MSFISPAWVDEPNGRGTWGVIQTCLVSLFLCIYTAIHLNIRPHQGNKQSLLRRIGASLLASAAPELTFICAVSQWSLARQLRSQLNHFEDIVSLKIVTFGPIFNPLVPYSGNRLRALQTE